MEWSSPEKYPRPQQPVVWKLYDLEWTHWVDFWINLNSWHPQYPFTKRFAALLYFTWRTVVLSVFWTCRHLILFDTLSLCIDFLFFNLSCVVFWVFVVLGHQEEMIRVYPFQLQWCISQCFLCFDCPLCDDLSALWVCINISFAPWIRIYVSDLLFVLCP